MATVKVHTYNFMYTFDTYPTWVTAIHFHTDEHIVHCKVSPLRFPTLFPRSPRAFKSSYFLNPESFLYHKDIPFAFLCIYGYREAPMVVGLEVERTGRLTLAF